MANVQINEVEMRLLSALVAEPERWSDPEISSDLNSLKPQDFHHRICGKVFAFLSTVYQKFGTTELGTALAYFDQCGEANQGFTRQNLAELISFCGPAPRGALKVYIASIKRDAQLRQATEIFQSAAAQAADPQGQYQLSDIMREAEGKLNDLVGQKPLEEDGCVDIRKAVLDYLTDLQNNAGHASQSVMSGFAGIDAITGGFQPGSLCVIGARPGVGKTTLALNIAENVARDSRVNYPVLMVSLEMPREQLVARIMSRAGRISTAEIKNNLVPTEKWNRIIASIHGLHLDGIEDSAENVCMYLCDRTSITATDIRQIALRIAKRHGGVGLIVLDYIQLLKPERPMQNRNYEVGEASRTLKTLALELKCPILALAQLNRNIEHRTDQTPVNADLRDSGALEQDADVVMLLSRDSVGEACVSPEVYGGESAETEGTTLTISKNRHGCLGEVSLALWGRCSHFFERKTTKATPLGNGYYVAS